MPFTFSHPAAVAAVWPGARRLTLPFAAMAIGTMTPDFEFFFHLRPVSLVSHSLFGLFFFCVPAGLVVTLLWERVAKAPSRALLGMPMEPVPAWKDVVTLRTTTAILLGAVTHVLWDGFTHGGYWGARYFPALLEPAIIFRGVAVPWFNLLQHASTIAGGLLVLGWLVRATQRDGDLRGLLRANWRTGVIAAIALFALVAGAANGLRGPYPDTFWSAQRWLGRVATGAMLGLGAGTIAFAWLFDRGAVGPRSERRS